MCTRDAFAPFNMLYCDKSERDADSKDDVAELESKDDSTLVSAASGVKPDLFVAQDGLPAVLVETKSNRGGDDM